MVWSGRQQIRKRSLLAQPAPNVLKAFPARAYLHLLAQSPALRRGQCQDANTWLCALPVVDGSADFNDIRHLRSRQTQPGPVAASRAPGRTEGSQRQQWWKQRQGVEAQQLPEAASLQTQQVWTMLREAGLLATGVGQSSGGAGSAAGARLSMPQNANAACEACAELAHLTAFSHVLSVLEVCKPHPVITSPAAAIELASTMHQLLLFAQTSAACCDNCRVPVYFIWPDSLISI